MTQISDKKINKIKEDILSYLFSITPKTAFVSNISTEIARDEEFTKRLMLDMEKKGLVVGVRKNSKGVVYQKRIRWRLNDKTFKAYKGLHERGI